MSIFNPWGEIRRLKAQLEAGYETYRIEETQQQADWAKKDILLSKLKEANVKLHNENVKLKDALAQAVDPRDAKTGRFTKKAK